jgi:hypothetical protein
MISRYAAARDFPIIPCTLCGSQANLQRQAVKSMLADWERRHPGRIETIFSGICHVSASHLADPALFDFAGLTGAPGRTGAAPGTAAADAPSDASDAPSDAMAAPWDAADAPWDAAADIDIAQP